MTKYETDDLCAIFMSGIDALRYLLNKAEDAPTTQVRTILNSFYIDDNHTTKVIDELVELWAARDTIRAVLQSQLTKTEENVTYVDLSNIPEGWQLVPKEPTDDMYMWADEAFWARSGKVYFRDIYKAMISAAPEPPQERKE